MDNLFRCQQGFQSIFSGIRDNRNCNWWKISQDFKLNSAVFPSASSRTDLFGDIILPRTFTGEAGVISPGFPIGVGP